MSKRIRWPWLLATLAGLMVAMGLVVAPNADPDASDGDAIRTAMDAANIPGLAVAYIEECKPSRVNFFGVENVESDVPITEFTAFEAASLSKPVFSYIVLALAEQGVLNLDDRIAKRIKYPRISNREGFEQLTPRLILSHQTGLTSWAGDPTDPERVDPIDFTFAPGGGFQYSGEGYRLLQYYVESVSGQTLDQLLERFLGDVMPNSSFGQLDADLSPAFGHDESGSIKSGRAMRMREAANAAYSLKTTIRDYANFLTVICEGSGLSQLTYKQMLMPQVILGSDDVVADHGRVTAETFAWTLGWALRLCPVPQVYFHWGDNRVYKSFVILKKSNGSGAVFLTNGAGGLRLIDLVSRPVVGSVDLILRYLGVGGGGTKRCIIPAVGSRVPPEACPLNLSGPL